MEARIFCKMHSHLLSPYTIPQHKYTISLFFCFRLIMAINHNNIIYFFTKFVCIIAFFFIHDAHFCVFLLCVLSIVSVLVTIKCSCALSSIKG